MATTPYNVTNYMERFMAFRKGDEFYSRIMHGGKCVYDFLDSMNRWEPGLKDICNQYPAIAITIAKYPSFINILNQYPEIVPVIAEYPGIENSIIDDTKHYIVADLDKKIDLGFGPTNYERYEIKFYVGSGTTTYFHIMCSSKDGSTNTPPMVLLQSGNLDKLSVTFFSTDSSYDYSNNTNFYFGKNVIITLDSYNFTGRLYSLITKDSTNNKIKRWYLPYTGGYIIDVLSGAKVKVSNTYV